MAALVRKLAERAVELHNPRAAGQVVLVCEHASNVIPAEFQGLGLSEDLQKAHIAWDPGALPVARHLADLLDAPLVSGGLSRLLYDCNRPPEAPDAVPARSEIYDIPGNRDLDEAAREVRVQGIYRPFRARLAETVSGAGQPVLVTIHSFTPVYKGVPRAVQIGILHDDDSRLADALLRLAPHHTALKIARNDPYGPAEGVTHTLRAHALPEGLMNVMIEIRNDLITTGADQREMAEMLHGWIGAAIGAADLAHRPVWVQDRGTRQS